tara:strand:- start:35 stop:277 length:243 start_codon:yes stop_codon:yes gene_type:complete
MIDLTYLNQGVFTVFFPESKSGEEAWRKIASKTEGTGKIFTMHLKDTLKQLRNAGFKVAKAKKPIKADFKAIFKEMIENS